MSSQLSRFVALSGTVIAFACICGIARGADSDDETTQAALRVRIVSEDSKPVQGAEAFALLRSPKNYRTPKVLWRKANNEGIATFSADDLCSTGLGEKPEGTYKLVVRAKGHAPDIRNIDLPTTAGQPAEIQLKHGRKIELVLKSPSKQVPDSLIPCTTDGPLSRQAMLGLARGDDGSGWVTSDPVPSGSPMNLTPMDRVGNGHYEFHITDDSPPLYLVIDHPGFLRGWQSPDPFSKEQLAAGKVEINLPSPGTVTVKFPSSATLEKLGIREPLRISMSKTHEMPVGGYWGIPLGGTIAEAGKNSITFSDLCPGNFSFKGRAGDMDTDEQGAQVEGGDTSEVELAAQPVIPAIRVVDAESSQPIPGAEGYIMGAEGTGRRGSQWKSPAADGLFHFRPTDTYWPGGGSGDQGSYEVFLRAPGYAAASVPIKMEAASQPVPQKPRDVALEKGRRVELVLKAAGGREIPAALRPVITDAAHFSIAWHSIDDRGNDGASTRTFSLLQPERLGDARYSFQVTDKTPPIWVLVNQREFLRQFEAGPFSQEHFTSGVIEVALPEPGGITAKIDVTGTTGTEAGDDSDRYAYVSLSRTAKTPNEGSYSMWVENTSVRETTTSLWHDLAPGDYTASASGPRGSGRSQKKVTVSSGKTEEVALEADAAANDMRRTGTRSGGSARFPEVNVTDEKGVNLATADVMIRKLGGNDLNAKWRKAPDGRLRLRSNEFEIYSMRDGVEGKYEVVARAADFATSSTTIEIPTSSTEITLRLKKGPRLKFSLRAAPDAKPIPDALLPGVFATSDGISAWTSTQPPWQSPSSRKKQKPEQVFSRYAINKTNAGSFEFQVDRETTGNLYVMVHEPGYLRGFQAGPFDIKEWQSSGTVEIVVPKASKVSIAFGPPASPPIAELDPTQKADAVTTTPSYSKFGIEISRSITPPGAGSWGMRAYDEEMSGTSGTLVADDLSSGSYSIQAVTGGKMDRYRPGSETFTARKSLKVQPGETTVAVLLYKPFDPEILKGKYTAVVKLAGRDTSALTGKPWKLTYSTSNFGNKTVAEGKVPDTATIEIPNLAGGIDRPKARRDFKEDEFPPTFNFQLGEDDLGTVSFVEKSDDGKEYRPLADGATRKEFEFRLPPQLGDPAPDFEMVDLASGEKFHLADLKGQVVFIDFWATWCGPCQDPMAHNQALMTKNGERWKGKAVILGASIDDELETVRSHVKKKEWTSVRQGWCSQGSGFASAAPKAYGVRGIPSGFLVDQKGSIVWKGHPSGYDIEAEIDKLLSAKQ